MTGGIYFGWKMSLQTNAVATSQWSSKSRAASDRIFDPAENVHHRVKEFHSITNTLVLNLPWCREQVIFRSKILNLPFLWRFQMMRETRRRNTQGRHLSGDNSEVVTCRSLPDLEKVQTRRWMEQLSNAPPWYECCAFIGPPKGIYLSKGSNTNLQYQISPVCRARLQSWPLRHSCQTPAKQTSNYVNPIERGRRGEIFVGSFSALCQSASRSLVLSERYTHFHNGRDGRTDNFSGTSWIFCQERLPPGQTGKVPNNIQICLILSLWKSFPVTTLTSFQFWCIRSG